MNLIDIYACGTDDEFYHSKIRISKSGVDAAGAVYAAAAVGWAVENGIWNGDENGLNLDDKALRFITMMYRMRKQSATTTVLMTP